MTLKKTTVLLAVGLLALASQVHAQALAPPSLAPMSSPVSGATPLGSLNSGVPDQALRGQPDPSMFPTLPEGSAPLVEINVGNIIANGNRLPGLPGPGNSSDFTRQANALSRQMQDGLSSLDQNRSARGSARARANRGSGSGSLVLRMH